MAIVKSFNATSIRKPGAYSRKRVDNSGGPALESNETLFLIGEASAGAPGDTIGFVEYSASRLADLVAFYKDGPIVDVAIASSRPSKTPGIGAPGKYLIWKTNSSTQATGSLAKSSDTPFTVKGRAWGDADNNYSVVVAAGTTANQKTISVTELDGTTESLGENDGEAILVITYTGTGSTATATVSGASRAALTLTTTLAGDQDDGSVDLSISLANYTMRQLVAYINEQTGYTATLSAATKAAKTANELDVISATNIKTALTMRRLQTEILELLNTSGRIEAVEDDLTGGVPDNQTVALTGGAQGASTNSDFSDGLSASLAETYNVVIPCISRDASVDIADGDLGYTDASSTYTVSAVHAAVSSHLTLRGNTKNHKEAQAFVGFRDAQKADCYTALAGIGSENVQGVMQDCTYLNAAGSIAIGQPHVVAGILAGIRLGTPVGTPLTYKYANVLSVGHFLSPTTLLATGDFNPAVDADDAIDNGVTFLEKANGGFRVVVDNTTYGIDDSFVYNRGSVVEASYYVNKTLRATAENIFVGNKTSNGLAAAIKAAVRAKLLELNRDDVQIITSSDDAPNGFVEETFVVLVTGNTANVQVEYKPVQGLDFVFFNFTLGDITQSA